MSSTSSMITCQICADDYDSKFIKTCSHCSEKACINCIKTYTINLQNTQKNCMFCSTKFNRIDLIKLFGSTFIDSTYYKNHIKELLFKEKGANSLFINEFAPLLVSACLLISCRYFVER